jgi:hypothetical protein
MSSPYKAKASLITRVSGLKNREHLLRETHMRVLSDQHPF